MRRAQPWRTNRARVLRANATSAEERLRKEVRGRRFGGLKFVRQAPVGPYFVDFLCREHRIAIEIDGATHCTDGEVKRDRERSVHLNALGYRIFRAHNDEVYDNLDGVLESLWEFVKRNTGGRPPP